MIGAIYKKSLAPSFRRPSLARFWRSCASLPARTFRSRSFSHPIGALYGLLWYYARAAVNHVRASDTGTIALGWLHIVGLVLSVAVAGLLFLSKAFRDLFP